MVVRRWNPQDLYLKFKELFPELEKNVESYKMGEGPHQIKIKCKDGSGMKFIFINSKNFLLECYTRRK